MSIKIISKENDYLLRDPVSKNSDEVSILKENFVLRK